jgi:hypothetical protein
MGMKRRPRRETLDEVLLAKLCHEYRATDTTATDDKIRRSLRYYGYDVDRGMLRVPHLREFKNRLLEQFSRPLASSYYLRLPNERGFAAMRDFDLLRLRDDMAEKYPSVDHGLVGGFVNHAIYLYYLR